MLKHIALPNMAFLILVAVFFLIPDVQRAHASDDACNSGWLAGGWKAQYKIVDTEDEQAMRIYYTNTPTGIQFRLTRVIRDGRERNAATAHHFDKMFARKDLYKLLAKHQPYKRHAASGDFTNTYDYEYVSRAQLQVVFSNPQEDWRARLNGAIKMSYNERISERELLGNTLKPGKSKVKGGWSFNPNKRDVSNALRRLVNSQGNEVDVVSYIKPREKKAVPLMNATISTSGLKKLVDELPKHLKTFEGPNAVMPCPVDEDF